MITKRVAYGGVAMLFALGGMTAASGTASAAAPSAPVKASAPKCHPKKSGWKCDAGAGWASAEKGKSDVRAQFLANGEHLYIDDHYSNGHWTVAYLKVAGSGTARFTSKGKKRRNVNLSYSENKRVWVKVCTSGSSKAVCSSWSTDYYTT